MQLRVKTHQAYKKRNPDASPTKYVPSVHPRKSLKLSIQPCFSFRFSLKKKKKRIAQVSHVFSRDFSLKNKTKYSQSSRVSISSSQNKHKKTLRQKIKAHDRGSQPAGSGGKKKKKIKGNPEGKTHYSCNTVIGQENQKDVSSSRPPLNPPPPPPPSFPSNDHNPSPQSGAVFGSLTYHLKKKAPGTQSIHKKKTLTQSHTQPRTRETPFCLTAPTPTYS